MSSDLQKQKNRKVALDVASTGTSYAMKAATPAVAAAFGLSSGTGIAGAVALASAFPIGTIIVAVPILVSIGFSTAKWKNKKNTAYLSGDQKEMLRLMKKYDKNGSTWRKWKADKLLKDYEKHLDKGSKKKLFGKKAKSKTKRWRAKKAKIEMQLGAIYMSEQTSGNPQPITSSDQSKNRKLAERIQKKQRSSVDPVTSPITVTQQSVSIDEAKMQKTVVRAIQRPNENTMIAKGQEPPPPVSIPQTIASQPGAGWIPPEIVESYLDDPSKGQKRVHNEMNPLDNRFNEVHLAWMIPVTTIGIASVVILASKKKR